MPIHDLVCGVCGVVQPDTYVPLVVLPEPIRRHGFVTRHTVAFPDHCGQPMTYLPPHCAVDVYESGATTVEVSDGQGGFVPRRVSSLRDIRRLERESEAAAAEGRGQRMVWRDYSQDRTNQDVHTMAADGEQPATLSKAAAAKFGPGIRRSADEPTAALGPGVTESTASVFHE
jgi:hypothetical protein